MTASWTVEKETPCDDRRRRLVFVVHNGSQVRLEVGTINNTISERERSAKAVAAALNKHGLEFSDPVSLRPQ